MDALYQDLRKLAGNMLARDSRRAAMQPTELVHECALRLFNLDDMSFADRAHFLAMAATTMRRVLVDQARKAHASKRAGQHVTLLTGLAAQTRMPRDTLAVHDALTSLAEISADRARIVEMKFFGGMTNVEIATALDVSESTVKRSWRSARAWLELELGAETPDRDGGLAPAAAA
nr:ECF-type sigma factor [Pacificimonas pallii]